MNEKYKEIINLPHHVSAARPHMSMIDRAAQFSPFAALTGHSEALDETSRLTDVFIELDEDEKQVLDARIHMLMDFIDEKPEISITYFMPDDKKDGGAYVTVTGYLKRINSLKREIVMSGGEIIPIDCVNRIQGALFGKEIPDYI